MDTDRAADRSPVLRRAVPQDIPEITIMMADFHADDRLAWHPAESHRAIGELLAHEAHGIFWLIELDGQPIGFLVLTFGFSLEFHGRNALVDEFYIRPEFRCRGIGTKALDHVVHYCAGNGIRTMHLEVEDSNPRVRRLYDRHGFTNRGFYLLSRWIPPGRK